MDIKIRNKFIEVKYCVSMSKVSPPKIRTDACARTGDKSGACIVNSSKRPVTLQILSIAPNRCEQIMKSLNKQSNPITVR